MQSCYYKYMHDISDAEPVRDDNSAVIGHIKQVDENLWIPIDTNRQTISGPTGKEDAIAIVHRNTREPIQPTN